MGDSLQERNCTSCTNCNKYIESVDLLKSKLKNIKTIHNDSINLYREELKKREYELIIRECEVVREIDTLKAIIVNLTDELKTKGISLSILGTNLKLSDDNNIKNISIDVINDAKKYDNLLNKESTVKENVKEIETVKVIDKQTVNVVVNKNVKEELSKDNSRKIISKKSAKIPNTDIILPTILNLTDETYDKLYNKALSIRDFILSEANSRGKGATYTYRKLNFAKNHLDFLISMSLLIETIPKTRGSYAWTKVTNILKECEDYREIVSDFLVKTDFKLTYLNIRNWYLSLQEVLANMKK